MKYLLLTLSLALFSHIASAHNHPGMSHLVFADGAIHAHATWVQGPRTPDESIMRLEWKNGANHSPMEPPGNFEVELQMDMPGHSHGSGPTQIMRVVDTKGNVMVGVYDVTSMYFVMEGDWQVKVTLSYPNGAKETQTINLNVEGMGHQH